MSADSNSTSGIDDSLYSRQRYVMGDQAMEKLAAASVLVHRLNGLGAEVAKNLALAGVRRLSVQDNEEVGRRQLGDQFFLRAAAASSTAAEASLQQLAELNPYVSVDRHPGDLATDESLDYLAEFDCVVLVNAEADTLGRVSDCCRRHGVRLVCSSVHGLMGSLYNDFGEEFTVADPTGEEFAEEFVAGVTREASGRVRTADSRPHRLCVGDCVQFREVRGMRQLNGRQFRVVAVPSPDQFDIDCDTRQLDEYECGGSFVCVAQAQTVRHRAPGHWLLGRLLPPLCCADLGRCDSAPLLHCLHVARLRCGRGADAGALLSAFSGVAEELGVALGDADVEFARRLAPSVASGACLQPLAAFFGGVAAQEALKALTAKFVPLSEWLYLDAVELADDNGGGGSAEEAEGRYGQLADCVGADAARRLRSLRVFMVGCGAIGCELLKNFALCGLCCSEAGRLVVTDDDVIEKSNLNRQFLFRSWHIRQPKATVAAAAAKDINPDLRVDDLQLRVGPDTERATFNDAFFAGQDVCVNALDNVAARRYMDRRCVTNQRPLFESGTMGAKGHVQAIVPFVTESYGAQQDPIDEEVPYCTLKTFPQRIEHCIEWAREKFASSFSCKPALVARFWANNAEPAVVAERLRRGELPADAADAYRYLRQLPTTWRQCLQLGRLKFEKYFRHRALNILRAFPPDTRLSDGALFWSPPKRQPQPVVFDAGDPLHASFVRTCATLYAVVCGVRPPSSPPSAPDEGELAAALAGLSVPEFVPSNKRIVTEEAKSRTEAEAESTPDPTDPAVMAELFDSLPRPPPTCRPIGFEKDDDLHVELISAMANLRARMYCLDTVDRLKVKKIAGRIVPAIATTTAAVAGLVTLEVLKFAKLGLGAGQPADADEAERRLSLYRNCFLNLAVPLFVLSQPGPCRRQPLPKGLSFTEWDRWDLPNAAKGMLVSELLRRIQTEFGLVPSMICQGPKSVYIPMMPGHRKRLGQKLLSFARLQPGDTYIDLIVMYEADAEESAAAGNEADEETDVCGPTVRVHFCD